MAINFFLLNYKKTGFALFENPMTCTITLYGIPNCDTVKKSRQWFAERGHAVTFHDFKKHGLNAATLAQWVQALGWESLLNRRGTTWRQLDAATQAQASDAAGAQAVMLAHLSLIKRPIVVVQRSHGPAEQAITAGWAPDEWASLLV